MHTRGYTLIEILVVIGIMGVLMGMGVATYSKMNDRVKVEEAANLLTSQLRAWQKQADAGVGSNECTGANFSGLVIKWESEATVSALVSCSAGAGSHSQFFYPLPNRAKIDSFAAFTFKPLAGGVFTTDTNPIVLRVKNVTETVIYSISISGAGGIRVYK